MQIDRRSFLTATTLIAGCAHSSVTRGPDDALTAIGDLRVSRLKSPLGLEDRQPSFSWLLLSSQPDVLQVSYRVRVSSSENAAIEGRADLWDSGDVVSSLSSGIPYGGAQLVSRQRCFWTVEIRDNANSLARSELASWEMGLLDPSDWIADWLAVEDAVERDDREAGLPMYGAPTLKDGRQHFRFDFSTREAASARLVLVLRGAPGEVSLDGEPLILPYRDPNAFGRRPAARFDVVLDAGPHSLAVDLGPEPGIIPRATVSVGAQLRFEEAGAARRITTGWRTSPTAASGWRRPDAILSGWSEALPDPSVTKTSWPPTPARLLRRRFRLERTVRSARLYVTALGGYEARLNGRAVSDDKLASENTDFRKRALYRAHDVTQLLARGNNVLGLWVGDGWYASYQAPDDRYPFGEAPRRALAQLEVTYDDGSKAVVTSDSEWKSATSPVIESEIYNGETYDARLEQRGWDSATFKDEHWSNVWVAPKPDCQLAALTSPPIRAQQVLDGSVVTQPKPDTRVYDFGQNHAGWARLEVTAEAGTRIILKFAEILGSDGFVDQSNLRAARATDTYIARGEGVEVFEPRFTYHGFRYVQVEGAPETMVLKAIVLSSDLEETGDFKSGASVINKLWLNTLWSQRSNFVGIPTDCPQRDERLGWTGDARIFWEAAAYNMDVFPFTRRFLNDVRDGQNAATGGTGIFAPMPGDMSAFGPMTQAMPGWSDAVVLLPWVAAYHSGDMTVVDENWDAMRRFMDGILQSNPDHVWRRARSLDLGDWLSLDAKAPNDETTPKTLLSTALLAQSFDQMADMAAWTGRAPDETAYREHAAATRRAFAQFISADGVVGNGSHTSYILALALGLAPSEQKAAVTQNFVADVRKRGTLLSCGFIGTPLSLDAVAETGDVALLFDLLLRTEFPSWGYMVSRGATTIWERWNSDVGDVAMNSFNHYALGAVTGFIYRRLAGIEAIEPGFGRLRMRPLVDQRVGHLEASYKSVRGAIRAKWRFEGNVLHYEVELPPNTTAQVEFGQIGFQRGATVMRAGEFAGNDRTLPADAPIKVGSGRHHFILREGKHT
jgi:alpha-L-rhamnosidase